MSYETIILEKEGAVATLTLNRPDRLNAFSRQMAAEVNQALDEIGKDQEIRALVMTGAGRGFCSGADVSELARSTEASVTETVPGRHVRGEPNMVRTVVKLRNLKRPVLAAVNGIAAGAGFGLVMACDIRIASENARFSQLFVRRGLVPDGGSTYFLPRLVGPAKACELMFTGDIIDAREAERIALVNRVVPPESLMEETMALAKRIASGPPIAIGLTKELIYKGAVEPDLMTQANLEIYAQSVCLQTEDAKEGTRSFLEKREPQFKGR